VENTTQHKAVLITFPLTDNHHNSDVV